MRQCRRQVLEPAVIPRPPVIMAVVGKLASLWRWQYFWYSSLMCFMAVFRSTSLAAFDAAAMIEDFSSVWKCIDILKSD